MEFVVSGKVKDLQAALFPVQPIPGNSIASQCLQTRFGLERKDLDSVLSLTSGGFVRCRASETKESFQALLVDPNYIGLDEIALLEEKARWPTECQVLPEEVEHVDYSPSEPEPFYIPTGKEPKPKPIGDESGTIIYRYCPASATNYFSRSCIRGSLVLSPDTPAAGSESADCVTNNNNNNSSSSSSTSDLCFESRFESGNLGKVIKITDTYYQLHLRKDLYTQRHMQWYYFRVSNTRSGTMYRFSIVNLCKEDSLYNEGLRPLLYSVKDAATKSIGWRRCGENISYYKNDSSSDEEKEKHTLTFNIYFPHDHDTVYLAHCYPYTYSDLQAYLLKIVKDPVKMRFTKLRLLCRSLAGNGVYYLTITAPAPNDEATRRKKGVVITARVHPGETPSSWIMKGIIDFLTGESNQARELRERFIFKLVPMLNPDGVIVGNNRCSLSGKDLNRQYRTVMRESYPSVWHTKLMIRRLMEECGIAMYCDLHAHSRKHNIFIYGCENKRTAGGCPGKLAEQVFPLMLHKNAADKFSFENCKFHIEKGKEGTGRVVVWLMGIQNSYTMEASLGGSRLGSRSGTHFSTQDYEQIGKAFCETLLDFSDEDPIKEKLRTKIIARLMKEGSSADEPTNIALTDYSSDEGDTSDSSSQEDNNEMLQRRLNSCAEDRRYLCVPPPSPILLKPATADPFRKLLKKPKSTLSRTVLVRRKMRNRKAMELPTTDPGSDLCDVSDSGDETNVRSAAEMKGKSSDDEARYFGKENCEKKKSDISLPLIVRPRSLSLGEEIISADLTKKNKRRLRRRRLPRPLRNLSPVLQRSQDMQIKLLSLRQQIWTGTGNYEMKNERVEISMLNNCPLSWGTSKMAFEYQTDNEAFLESCSRKLEEITNTKNDPKKVKKKTRKKSTKIIEIPPVINIIDEENKQTVKKKKPRIKRQRAVKSSLEPLDNNNMMLTSDGGLDSLKLFGTSKLPKVQAKQKSDSKRKLNKAIIAATVTTSKMKPKPPADSVGNSSSSENSPLVSRRKSIKKKSQTTKKRIQSAVAAKKDSK